jgi:hypothetical protein
VPWVWRPFGHGRCGCEKTLTDHVEVMAQLLSQIYATHHDRQCKDQLLLRFVCKLVALGVSVGDTEPT